MHDPARSTLPYLGRSHRPLCGHSGKSPTCLLHIIQPGPQLCYNVHSLTDTTTYTLLLACTGALKNSKLQSESDSRLPLLISQCQSGNVSRPDLRAKSQFCLGGSPVWSHLVTIPSAAILVVHSMYLVLTVVARQTSLIVLASLTTRLQVYMLQAFDLNATWYVQIPRTCASDPV